MGRQQANGARKARVHVSVLLRWAQCGGLTAEREGGLGERKAEDGLDGKGGSDVESGAREKEGEQPRGRL